ncbi:conserved hypothetical protein [Pyrobaculum arsenaticum DSM 13514]|uniref:Uncharacterized protein n=1 Tax=Pyrobaculum arsenaticum (strain DSM 13514 / JCM 11321 / PZ6) TaxID=340102 RepID=A4WM32_PYRAR|nr:conserved hypothetical protein [Pyrobaculum arsenaticum DSM 13514]
MPRRGENKTRIKTIGILGFFFVISALFIALEQSYKQAHCPVARCLDPLLVVIALLLLIVGSVFLLFSIAQFINVKIEENLKT